MIKEFNDKSVCMSSHNTAGDINEENATRSFNLKLHA